MYQGDERIIDSITSTLSSPIITPVGLSGFYVINSQADLKKTPFLVFKFKDAVPRDVLHDQSTFMQIIHKITPSRMDLTEHCVRGTGGLGGAYEN